MDKLRRKRHGFPVWFGGWMVLWAMAGGVPVHAQPVTTAPAGPVSPYDGRTIRTLTITGLQSVDEAYVRNQITSRTGQPYSQATVQRDVSRLLQKGYFLDVRAEPTPVDDEVNLTFTLSEKPKVASVEFVGNRKFKPKALIEVVPFGQGDALDLYDVRRGAEAIQRLYREKGYAYVEVTYDEALIQSERRVVYQITENERVRVRSIRLEGNTAFKTSTLRHQIATKTYLPIFRTGDFDPERAERDAATLRQYYRDRGYLDAEVGYETSFLGTARERMRVTFRINEGTLYNVKEIRIQGNHLFTSDEIINRMRLVVGEAFNNILLQADVKELTEEKYGAQGYIEVRVTPSWVFAEEPAQVIVTLTIEEGEQFRVGNIVVHGHFRTQEKVVRRELRMFEPEQIYNLPEARAAEKRIRNTGLFTEAQISPVVPAEPQPRVRDVVVNVKESERTTEFIAGVGASSDNGIVGNIMLENRNFDLKDRPRSWGEFLRGHAFRGAGQTARIQFEPGTKFNRFRIDFREPYLGYRPIGFNTSLYLFERKRDAYDEQRIGGNISFDHRFEKGPLKNWTGEVAFREEYIIVDSVEGFAARDIKDVKGGSFLSSIKLSMLHDTTDSRLDPSRGHRFSVSWEQAVPFGDYTFAKITAGYTRHFTILTDEQDRKSVLTLHADTGGIIGDAPVFERFYAGGIGSMRGFDFRGVSPRQGLKHNRIGGDFMVLTGGEYSFPLVGKIIRGVTFLDMGTVERDFGITSWRAAVGGGVRLTLDIFGAVPMEFDLALPIAKDGEDNTRVFSFFVGLPFL